MNSSQQIKNSLDFIQNNLKNIKASPQLIAVTKTHPIEIIEIAYKYGIRDFGENYAKEFEAKAESFLHTDIRWHYLGKLQSNKIKIISKHATWVHSLCEIRHALLLNQHRQNLNPINVLIEVNISNDRNKGGIKELAEVIKLAHEIKKLPNLKLRGLMGIASLIEDNALIAEQFQLLESYLDELKNTGFEVDQLSMGMSGDYQIAAQNGSTMIRIGSGIFGDRVDRK